MQNTGGATNSKNWQQRVLYICNVLFLLLMIVACGFVYTKKTQLLNTYRALLAFGQTHAADAAPLIKEQPALNNELNAAKASNDENLALLAQAQANLEAERKNTDALLELLITSDRPDYKALSDADKVRHIRNWISLHLPHGNFDFYDMPPMQVLVKNLQHERAVWCGGAAYLFAHTLNKLGFAAVDVNFGIKDSHNTHVMTVVRISENGKSLLMLTDPTTGLEFFEKKGSTATLADFKNIVLTLKNNDKMAMGNYFYSFEKLPGKKFILDFTRPDMGVTLPSGQKCVLESSLFEMEQYQACMVLSMEEGIKRHEEESSLFSYLLYPLGVGAANMDLRVDLRGFFEHELGVQW